MNVLTPYKRRIEEHKGCTNVLTPNVRELKNTRAVETY